MLLALALSAAINASAARAATSPQAAPLAQTAPGPASSFRVGHLNILYKLSDAQFRHDLQLVTSRSDMVGLNEVRRWKGKLQAWADANGWTLYAPGSGSSANNALLARKSRFTKAAQGSIFAGDTGGSGQEPPPRYINWVKYQDKTTGRYVTHIVTHLNSHIDNGGRPYNLPRTTDAEKHIRQIKALADAKRAEGQVIVSADMNVDFVADKRVKYRNFPYAVLEDKKPNKGVPGLRSNYAQFGVKGIGTHGNRHIDYIYNWVRLDKYRVMDMKNYWIIGGTHSDHNAVIASFQLKPKG